MGNIWNLKVDNFKRYLNFYQSCSYLATSIFLRHSPTIIFALILKSLSIKITQQLNHVILSHHKKSRGMAKEFFLVDFKLGNENFKIIIIIHMLWTSYWSLPLTLHTTSLKKERKEPFNLYFMCLLLSLPALGTHKVFLFLFCFCKKNYFNSNTLWHFFPLPLLLSRQLENSMIIENVQKNISKKKLRERIY